MLRHFVVVFELFSRDWKCECLQTTLGLPLKTAPRIYQFSSSGTAFPSWEAAGKDPVTEQGYFEPLFLGTWRASKPGCRESREHQHLPTIPENPGHIVWLKIIFSHNGCFNNFNMFQEWFFDWLYQRPQMTPSHFEQCHVNIGLKETVPEELDKVKKWPVNL